ncbi:MAG TPA: hypothetical protein VMU39_17790 [Solirubrobacteraceae bacterium]|nr:hypothetical protein [Solirubrobacteraceae bacterium]
MIWILAIVGAVVLMALTIYWLEQPLWHRVEGVQAIESLLVDLVSPASPWPLMRLEAHSQQRLLFSRQRTPEGFRLDIELLADGIRESELDRIRSKLRAASFSVSETAEGQGLGIDIGAVGPSTLSEAAQAARIVLAELGVERRETLRARYGGKLDELVVAPRMERLAGQKGAIARLIARAGLRRTNRR